METNSNKKNILHITSKVTVGNSAGGARSHDKLANLDYASSGHIGFASSEELNEIKNKLFILEEEIRQLKQKLSQE